jgi:YidC/Oxa1 family membrane protein insertase
LIDSISVYLGEILKFFYQLTGNYAYSIILFAVAIKLALLYFTNQQYKSMKDMQKIQPEMNRLKEKYKGEPEKLNEKTLELFRTHNVNPLSGCLPLIIQMPIIYALYRTIAHFEAAFAKATFLWIGCMPKEQIPQIHFMGQQIPLFGSSLATPDLPLVIIYGLSMYLSQMMTMTSSPQAVSQKSTAIFMSIFITFVMFKFQSALILYWLVFNLLSIVQQHLIMNSSKDEDLSVKEIDSDLKDVVDEPKKTEILEAGGKKKKKRK